MKLGLGLSLVRPNYSGSAPLFNWDLLRDGMTPKRGSVSFSRASTATAQHPTTGYITSYAINEARIESDGLLVESPNTNYVLRSSDYASSPWTAFNILSSAAVLAPTNANEARRIIPNTSNSTHAYTQKNLTKNTDSTFCVTGFFKPQGYSWILVTSLGTNNGVAVGSWFNVTTGALGDALAVRGTVVSSEITPAANGFYRIKLCYTHEAGFQDGCGVAFYVCNANGVSSYAGNGTSGIDVFGMECKPTQPDSYIPTVASATTRSADVCTLTMPASVSSIRVTYGDNTTATVSVTPGGSYQLPASQKKYKSIISL